MTVRTGWHTYRTETGRRLRKHSCCRSYNSSAKGTKWANNRLSHRRVSAKYSAKRTRGTTHRRNLIRLWWSRSIVVITWSEANRFSWPKSSVSSGLILIWARYWSRVWFRRMSTRKFRRCLCIEVKAYWNKSNKSLRSQQRKKLVKTILPWKRIREQCMNCLAPKLDLSTRQPIMRGELDLK